MDNFCHTLVGAAFGEAGLKQRTRFGNATLMISANLPDVDVLSFLTDTDPISFRRGWTHGILAQLTLPLACAAVMYAIGRLRPRHDDAEPPLHAGWLLLLSYLGVYSHVFLDFLNNYGVRLLAPVDWRWFYGDALFIADVWLWLALGVGIWLARRQRRPAPARAALAFSVCYIAAMLTSAQAARTVVSDTWREARGITPRALMVGPLPFTPFTRAVIVDAGDRYETGTFRWWPTSVTFDPEPIPKNAGHPFIKLARPSPRIREFLVWSRFPFWTITPETSGGTRVTLTDVRFMGAPARFDASIVVSAVATRIEPQPPAGAAASTGSSYPADRSRSLTAWSSGRSSLFRSASTARQIADR
jgi:inner membrane protein